MREKEKDTKTISNPWPAADTGTLWWWSTLPRTLSPLSTHRHTHSCDCGFGCYMSGVILSVLLQHHNTSTSTESLCHKARWGTTFYNLGLFTLTQILPLTTLSPRKNMKMFWWKCKCCPDYTHWQLLDGWVYNAQDLNTRDQGSSPASHLWLDLGWGY